MFINEFSSSSVEMNHESGDSRNARRGLSRRDRDDLVRNDDDNESSVDEIGNVSRFHSVRDRLGWDNSSSRSRSRNCERKRRSLHPSTSGRSSPDYRSRSLRQIPKYQDLEVEGRRQNTRRQSNTNYYEYLNSSKQGLDSAYENRLVERNPSNVLSVRIDLPHKSRSIYGGENATYTLPRRKKNQFPDHQSSLPRGPPTNKKPKIEVKEFDFFEIKQSKSSDLVAGDNSSDKQSRKFKFERITFNSSSSNCEIKVKTKPSLKDVTFGDSSHSSEQKKDNLVVVAGFDEMSTKETFQCDENIANFVTKHCSNRFCDATLSITNNGVEIKSDYETVKTVKLSLEKIKFFTRTVYFMGPSLDGFFTSDWIKTSDDIEQKLSCVMMVKKIDDVEPEVGRSSIAINVCQDDIINQTTDAVVNGVGDDFDLNWGKISPAILVRAGTDIASACSSNPLVSTPYVRATKAGNLSCKYIFHMVTPTSCDELTERIRIVLDEAEKLGVKSISFPTLGAGGIGLNPKDVAEAMKKAFVEFKTQNLNQSIEVIRVVVFEVRLKGDFDFLTSLNEAKPKKNLGRSMERWSVLITGDDLYRLIAAESRVSALRDSILEEEEESILHLEEHDLLEIDKEAHSCKVHCTLSENANSFKITGQKEQVKRMRESLNRLCDEIEEASIIAEAQLWKWKTDGENEHLPLPLRVSHRMVKHHKKSKNEVFLVNVCGEEISFNFATKTFQSSDSSKSGSIISSKAEEKNIKLPAKWEDMQDETFRLCLLPSNSQEYRDVKQQFNKSNPSCSTIVSIERVQNSELYSHYRVEKKNVTRTIAGSNPVKRNLFHGTSKQDAEKICRHGFNRSYAGKNATMYGKGTYFARDSSYSVNYADSDFTGNKQMFLAKVVTGNYTQGSSSYIAPPQQSNGKLYDSVVNSSTSPSIFVVFTDHKAYPAYLITFC